MSEIACLGNARIHLQLWRHSSFTQRLKLSPNKNNIYWMKINWQSVTSDDLCNTLWQDQDKFAENDFFELLCVDNANINININININRLLRPSRSSSKYDLRGKCRRTCIRQGTQYGRAIAPTLMELLHDHPRRRNRATSRSPNSPRPKNIFIICVNTRRIYLWKNVSKHFASEWRNESNFGIGVKEPS